MTEVTPLRRRCIEFLERQSRNRALPTFDGVQELIDFVQSEQGRSADGSLENTRALILYFPTDHDREEFKQIALEALPGMRAKEIP